MKSVPGVVKYFDHDRAYGYITPDDGSLPECFVHCTDIHAPKWQKTLATGQRVRFEIQQSEHGARAVRVIPGGYTARSRAMVR